MDRISLSIVNREQILLRGGLHGSNQHQMSFLVFEPLEQHPQNAVTSNSQEDLGLPQVA